MLNVEKATTAVQAVLSTLSELLKKQKKWDDPGYEDSALHLIVPLLMQGYALLVRLQSAQNTDPTNSLHEARLMLAEFDAYDRDNPWRSVLDIYEGDERSYYVDLGLAYAHAGRFRDASDCIRVAPWKRQRVRGFTCLARIKARKGEKFATELVEAKAAACDDTLQRYIGPSVDVAYCFPIVRAEFVLGIDPKDTIVSIKRRLRSCAEGNTIQTGGTWLKLADLEQECGLDPAESVSESEKVVAEIKDYSDSGCLLESAKFWARLGNYPAVVKTIERLTPVWRVLAHAAIAQCRLVQQRLRSLSFVTAKEIAETIMSIRDRVEVQLEIVEAEASLGFYKQALATGASLADTEYNTDGERKQRIASEAKQRQSQTVSFLASLPDCFLQGAPLMIVQAFDAAQKTAQQPFAEVPLDPAKDLGELCGRTFGRRDDYEKWVKDLVAVQQFQNGEIQAGLKTAKGLDDCTHWKRFYARALARERRWQEAWNIVGKSHVYGESGYGWSKRPEWLIEQMIEAGEYELARQFVESDNEPYLRKSLIETVFRTLADALDNA